MFFDGVVDPLDEHAGQVGSLQQIGHRGAMTKRVHRPPAARSYAYDGEGDASSLGLCSEKKEGLHFFVKSFSPAGRTKSSTKYFITHCVRLHLLHEG